MYLDRVVKNISEIVVLYGAAKIDSSDADKIERKKKLELRYKVFCKDKLGLMIVDMKKIKLL